MRILINGVYTGDNCPPFYKYLKKLGHTVKIVDLTYFNEPYNAFSPLINSDDIIIPNYSRFDLYLFKAFNLTGYSFLLKLITKKVKGIINNFSPDIILNHQISRRADIMIQTKFKPQLNFIYGSEIRNKKRLNSKAFKNAILFSEITYGTVKQTHEIIIAKYPELRNKLKIFQYGLMVYDELKEVQFKGIIKLRDKWGLPKNKMIIYDDRSSRDLNSAIPLLRSIYVNKEELRSKGFYLLMIRGHGGTDDNMKMLSGQIISNEITDLVKIYDKVATNSEHFELLWLSDVIISLLPYDQFGLVILEGMFLKKYLILYDLPQYKEILNENAIYCKDLSEKEISRCILSLFKKGNNINLEANLNLIETNFKPDILFSKLEIELQSIVSNYNHPLMNTSRI